MKGCCPAPTPPWTALSVSTWRLAFIPYVASFPLSLASSVGAFWAGFSGSLRSDRDVLFAFSLQKLYDCDGDLAFCTDFFAGDSAIPLDQLTGGSALYGASNVAQGASALAAALVLLALVRLLIARVAASPASGCCRDCLPCCELACMQDKTLMLWTRLTASSALAGSAALVFAVITYSNAALAWSASSMTNVSAGATGFYLGAGFGCAVAGAVLLGVGGILFAVSAMLSCCSSGASRSQEQPQQQRKSNGKPDRVDGGSRLLDDDQLATTFTAPPSSAVVSSSSAIMSSDPRTVMMAVPTAPPAVAVAAPAMPWGIAAVDTMTSTTSAHFASQKRASDPYVDDDPV